MAMLLTSFVKPALSDYINFIHGERCVSERFRNRRLGRGEVDFSLACSCQLQLSNLNSTCWMKQAVQRKYHVQILSKRKTFNRIEWLRQSTVVTKVTLIHFISIKLKLKTFWNETQIKMKTGQIITSGRQGSTHYVRAFKTQNICSAELNFM